jgi:hypothetical protein
MRLTWAGQPSSCPRRKRSGRPPRPCLLPQIAPVAGKIPWAVTIDRLQPTVSLPIARRATGRAQSVRQAERAARGTRDRSYLAPTAVIIAWLVG